MVSALPAIRSRLMSGAVLLHGDAHSGNVAIRKRGGSLQAVLFDWGRTRIGSPLEDVSSWLQSLGYWEWQARRRHDTLLQIYLAARGLNPVLTSELRELYWLAGASNALSGALGYHLSFVNENWCAEVRAQHALAACDWMRIIRRADACWRC
jgi:aminoglycoside phosphotransferase (APT) family kinase protein